MGFPVGEHHEHAIGDLGTRAQQLDALRQAGRERRPAFGRHVGIEGVEIQRQRRAVDGERREDVARPRERREPEPVAVEILHQSSRFPQRPRQPARPHVLGEHGARDVYREHEIEAACLGAEPLLAEFTRQTGIKVLPIFDSESVKTAGLAQRLIAEKDNPRADIFWSNEEMISHHLGELGALDTNAWTKAGYRTRRLIINTNFVSTKNAPKSLVELTDPKWSGKIALAYPLY